MAAGLDILKHVPHMKTQTRFPGDLLWIILWCLFLAGISLFIATVSQGPALRILYGVLGAIYLIAAVGLYRLQHWGRVFAGILFFLGVVLGLFALRKGFNVGTLFRILMNLYWGVYLFQSSTRRLFEASSGARLSLPGCISQSIYLVGVIAMVAVLLVLKSPKWVGIVVLLVTLVAYALFLEDRVNRWLAARFSPKPDDLDRDAWRSVRVAQQARLEGDLDRADRLLAPLRDSLTVRVLRGLLVMDRALRSDGLRRTLYDSAWVAPAPARDRLLEESRATDLTALVAERAALVDGLLEDDGRSRSFFGEEADERLQKITGRVFVNNPIFQHREAWEKRRPLCTGDRARTWLTARLWDAQAPEAAREAAGGSGDASLVELANLSVRLDQAARGLFNEEWVAENSLNLCLLPIPADAARLLYLDSPYIVVLGPEAVAGRLAARLELVSRLRRLRDDYPAESWIEIPWLLAQLTGDTGGHRTVAKFEKWWASRREAQLAFDGAFVSGLDAARHENWERAEEHFRDAVRAWPERTCAVYNHALALLQLDRHDEAEEIFSRLAAAEPDEAVFWMRAGDARRLQDRSGPAIEAYRKAAKLGGLEDEVALRLGLTLASEGREDEAERELDAATAKEFDADRLDELASFLESEGVYRLASRYREQAFQKRLGEKPTGEEEEDEDEEGDSTAGAT